MARTWKDRIVEKPRTFTMQNNADGTVTLIPAPGAIIEPGTPVNAANLNGIETELADKANAKRITSLQLNDTRLAAGMYTNTGDGILNNDGSIFSDGWWHVQVSKHFDNNGYGMQVATPFNSSSAFRYYRTSNETTWGSWVRILDQRDYDTLFQYANDGKTAVANAITARGVAASPSDTFSVLATKIGQIKRQASGTVTAVYTNGRYRLQVNGLAFTPSIIIAMHSGSVNQEYAMYWPANGLYYNGTRYSNWATHSGTLVYTNFDFIITSSSFDIICAYSGNFNWMAFE